MRDDGSGKLVNIFLKVKIDDVQYVVCIYTVSPWGRTSRVRSMNPVVFSPAAQKIKLVMSSGFRRPRVHGVNPLGFSPMDPGWGKPLDEKITARYQL